MLYDESTRLEAALVRATLAVRHKIAAQRVLLTMRGLRDALELHYNPNWELQPRVLTGQGPESGRTREA